jgi:hypothetical protein
MSTVTNRIARLENRFGTGEGQPCYLAIMCEAGSELDPDKCIGILRKYGFIPERHAGFRTVNLSNIPGDLNADGLERLLQGRGAGICGSRGPCNREAVSPTR